MDFLGAVYKTCSSFALFLEPACVRGKIFAGKYKIYKADAELTQMHG